MRKFAFCAVTGVAAAVSVAACAPTVSEAEMASTFPASASLCQPNEQALFQCQAGARTIALCGGGTGAGRYVQYRYGAPGAIEIAIPARGMAGISRANIPYSGGGETQVNVVSGGTTYSLYSRTIRTNFGAGGNNPEFSAGVNVRQGARQLADIGCTNPADATFDAATYDLLSEGQPVHGD